MSRTEPGSRDLLRLPLGEGHVDYVLVRRRGRRGVALRVDGTGLTVSAALSTPLAAIESFVRDNERWVRRRLAEWSRRRVAPMRWVEGAALPWLGGALRLALAIAPRPSARRLPGTLLVATRDGSAAGIERAVVAWYKRAAREHLVERVEELARVAGLAPPRLFISSAMQRWGSCNTKREVRLAWRLVKAPPELVDYVVCHELAHLRHMDHSARFWAEVERLCPGHRELRKRLLATDHLYRSF
jgi:predicted metal-dependent hydrolase